jgi:GDP-fucose transporter C1
MVPAARHSSATIAAVVLFYWVVSIALVFLNKLLLLRWDFSFPLTVTLFQLAFTWLSLLALGTLGQRVALFAFVPPYEIRPRTVLRVLPLTLTFIAMLATGNLCLKHVEVSFYQVARSLTICFSIALSYAMLGVTTSLRAIVACLVVVVGFAVGAKGEPQLSVEGLVFGVVSSVFVALYSILVKSSLALPSIDGNHWRLLAYNSAIAVPLMMPLAAWQEWAGVVSSSALRDTEFWIVMLLAAALAVLISVATFMQINYTSALTNNISGTVKAALQTVLAIVVFGNEVTPLNALGIVMVIGGSAWYGHIRFLESQAKK